VVRLRQDAPIPLDVALHCRPGEVLALVGPSGSGKSTVLRSVAGLYQPRTGMVTCDGQAWFDAARKVCLAPQRREVGMVFQSYALFPHMTALGNVMAAMGHDAERRKRALDLLAKVHLDGLEDRYPAALSGGQQQRVAVARALARDPKVLLLDEPTNHLDLPTILWLEDWLKSYQGALVMISHDRRFLDNVSKQTLWLERGVVRRAEFGFSGFPQWQEETYAAEEAELARMDNLLRRELHWLARGVTARRKRNMGRRRALDVLRSDRAQRFTSKQDNDRRANLAAEAGDMSGRLVIEAEKLDKSYGGKVIAKEFSTRILRGDRVGLIGPNGAGKTTLLRMLTGDLAPDGGVVRLGTNLEPAYFDQRRDRLDPERTVWDTLTDGRGDNVWVRGRPQHVVGYMKDFLFQENQARTPVRALSGGERNRLLLAKLLAKPSNLLILDEPTNDLDMDTLDLLEEVLADYEGTLLVVSHDPTLLGRICDNIVELEGK